MSLERAPRALLISKVRASSSFLKPFHPRTRSIRPVIERLAQIAFLTCDLHSPSLRLLLFSSVPSLFLPLRRSRGTGVRTLTYTLINELSFDGASGGATLFGRARCYDRHHGVDLAISRRHESPSNRSSPPALSIIGRRG